MVALRIGGVVPFTTVDFPGKHAAVVFCKGCDWRCPYCHNAHLNDASPVLGWEDVDALLKRRRGLLEAVVFSGGEPLLQRALPEALAQVRELGFEAGLHTGGSHPEAFRKALPWLDWVGFDFKAPFEKYETITKKPGSGTAAFDSLRLLAGSGVPFEVRTTVHPSLLPLSDLSRMAEQLVELGASQWVLQAFRPMGCRTAELLDTGEDAVRLHDMATSLDQRGFPLEVLLRSSAKLEQAV